MCAQILLLVLKSAKKKKEMDYHMTLKQFVNKLFVAVPGVEYPIELRAAENYDEDYDDNYAGPFLYNGTIPLDVFANSQSVMSAATLLCYGVAGGEADYKLNELLSIPIGPLLALVPIPVSSSTQIPTVLKTHTSPILVNSPPETRYTLIEFPTDLMELLGLPKYIHAAPIDIERMKKNKKYSDDDLKARGIDPILKNWICHAEMTIPDWCYLTSGALNEKMLVELHNIVSKCRPITVHCYSYTGTQRHEIQSNLKGTVKPKKL